MIDIPSTAILAKSPIHGQRITLADHTDDVLRATSAMFGETGIPTRLGQQWLRFFGIPGSRFDRFLRNLWLAAAFHDLGKANDGFQRAVISNAPQTIRHEHLSALLLCQDPLRGWLERQRTAGVDPEIVVSAVVSHHLKVSDKEFAQRLTAVSRPVIEVYAAAPDVAAVLGRAAQPFGGSPPDASRLAGRWDFATRIDPARDAFFGEMYRFQRSLRGSDAQLRLLLAVKAAVIAVDSAGSALRRTGQPIEDWLAIAFTDHPLTAERIEGGVIAPRIEQLRRLGRWDGFRDFQDAAGTLASRALLLSGCGTGKTLAAWKWIAGQLGGRPASRVIFLYPTRATATEGFRDYVSWAGPEEAALVSGTARFDLEGMFGNPGDSRRDGDYAVSERMFALGYWGRRMFSATVDAFLALMSNRYAALCMAPLLADSVIVVDEAHSFDRRMFTALEGFLRFFDVPVLCMTASLPQTRLRTLRDSCALDVFPHDQDAFPGLDRQARIPRYRTHCIRSEEALAIAQGAVLEGKGVLWVHNTVTRCQDAARALGKGLGDAGEILCYHSRFRLVDRKEQHERAITLFRDSAQGAALVTTQVCEMSLDLDADVLLTEAAPVPALIQRMGRCCRQPEPRDGRIGEVCVYEPPRSLPYEQAESVQGEEFARYLEGRGAVGHTELAAYLDSLPSTSQEAERGWTGFLDSAWYAMARDDSFREDSDVTVDCILDRDKDAYLRERANGTGRADGYILPVPKALAVPDAALPEYLSLAPASHYHPLYGFLDKEVSADA